MLRRPRVLLRSVLWSGGDESQLSVLTAFCTLALQAVGDRHDLPGRQRPPGGGHDDHVRSNRQCHQGVQMKQTLSCWY